MSYELASQSLPRYASRRALPVADRYPGLGATVATAPWMQGLPAAGDSKDGTRIAYAKRDHDLALNGDATALKNLQGQAVGSATVVGKTWYRAALADVNAILSARIAASVPATRVTPPVVQVPFTPQVLINPIVKQAIDMGFKIQQTSDGKMVAVNSDGAIVSKPLPVPMTAATDSNVLPPNAVQAGAPPQSRAPSSSGILSILDKLNQKVDATSIAAQNASSSGSVASSGGGAPVSAPADAPAFNVASMAGGLDIGALFQNPMVLYAGVALLGILYLSSSSGRKR